MLVSQFSFDLPRERIATEPANPRDAARLLKVSDDFVDMTMRDFPSLLRKGDLLVFNDTSVIPARLTGACDQASVEVTLHKQINPDSWKAFAKPARKLKPGSVFKVADDFAARVLAKNEGEVVLQFNVQGAELFARLEAHGSPPLPPYIARSGGPTTQDRHDYQTIYARHRGAVAAPTAGLHFTDAMFEAIAARGVEHVFVTLHVGAGTFLPVKVEDTKDHIMHEEYCILSEEVAEKINATRRNGGRVVAVGTTSLRLLESAASDDGKVAPMAADTNIFITPGYKFKATDALLTNFHLPQSTLFMLVSAFAGLDVMQEAYAHAIKQEYRFYSYGDACFLTR